MGLSGGWPGEAERLAARLQRWAAACSGYRKLRSCRISRGRQTMAHGVDSDEDAAVSVGVGAGAGAGAAPEAVLAGATGRCLPPRRSRPVGIKMFLTADEQTAIADAKTARPKHTVAHVTGNSSGVVLVAEQRAAARPGSRALLIERPAGQQAAGCGGGGIARPRPACSPAEPLLPLARGPPAQPAATAQAPPPRPAAQPPPLPALRVEDAEGSGRAALSRESSTSEEEEGGGQGGRIQVALLSGGSQREDILSVSVEEPPPQPQPQPPAMVRGCGIRKTAPAGSVRRATTSPDKPTAGDPAIGREAGRLVTRVDPRGRRELWWVSAAPPASPAPTPAPRGGLSEELRGLLSFRRARRMAQQQQQQLARRRVVAAADAADRRQWPAVLLTFERGVSPEPGCGPPSPHAMLAARKARLEIAAV